MKVFSIKNIFLFCVVTIFVFLRLYRLPQTLYFWGDIGRDHQALIAMIQDRKPVLLGPSNSQLPFNQSAWYYYLNLPLFVLTSHSPFTTALTGITLNFFAIALCFSLLWKKSSNEVTQNFWLIFFFGLYSFHPFILEQQRLTWNPAFALPFILVSLSIVWKVLSERNIQNSWLIIFVASVSFAIGMTYAVIPLVVFLMVTIFYYLDRFQRFIILKWLGIFLFIIFSPHILFEIKYDFLLTKQLLHESSTQTVQPFLTKLQSAIIYLFGFKHISSQAVWTVVMGFFITGVGIIFSSKKHQKYLIILSAIFLCSLGISLLVVDEFHTHYAIIFIVVILFIIGQLPILWKTLLAILFLFSWKPAVLTEFTRVPHRTVEDLEVCAEKVCSNYPQPMYVAAQAWHEFHSGYDYSFFFNKHGCYTRDISAYPGVSDTIAVVVDRAEFDHERTNFHELALFGKKNLAQKIVCSPELSVYIFSKDE